jgi:hypothetical protein
MDLLFKNYFKTKRKILMLINCMYYIVFTRDEIFFLEEAKKNLLQNQFQNLC